MLQVPADHIMCAASAGRSHNVCGKYSTHVCVYALQGLERAAGYQLVYTPTDWDQNSLGQRPMPAGLVLCTHPPQLARAVLHRCRTAVVGGRGLMSLRTHFNGSYVFPAPVFTPARAGGSRNDLSVSFMI